MLYERANRCKGGSDLNELLDVFVFYFVFTLGFSFIHLIVWTFGFMLKFDAVRDYVRAKFVDFDATSGLAYPVATEFFDRVIMRNRQQTEHDARVKECARLRRERKLVESKLTSIDEQVRLVSRARLRLVFRVTSAYRCTAPTIRGRRRSLTVRAEPRSTGRRHPARVAHVASRRHRPRAFRRAGSEQPDVHAARSADGRRDDKPAPWAGRGLDGREVDSLGE